MRVRGGPKHYRRLSTSDAAPTTLGGTIVALFSRRFAMLAAISASAIVASLLGPITTAAAADPITSDPAPTLLTPADDPNGTTPIKDLVLTWTAVAHATHYQVQLSPNGDWTNNVVTL